MRSFRRRLRSVGAGLLMGITVGLAASPLASGAPALHPAAEPTTTGPLHTLAPKALTYDAVAPRLSAEDADPPTIPEADPPLQYYGGPVMGTTPAGITLHAVFWAPAGYAFPPGYETTVDQFLFDAAAGSGQASNIFGVAGSYFQVSGGRDQYAQYLMHAGWADDPDPYPSSGGCVPDTNQAFSACVTDDQIAHEVNDYVVGNRDGADLADAYLFFFPPGVETCFTQADARQGGICSDDEPGSFCAYHTANTQPLEIYETLPYSGYCAASYATGTAAAQGEATAIGHETAESMTDPLPPTGWLDANGNEAADECVGDLATQTFGTDQWSVQKIFSNVNFDQNPATGGCVAAGLPGPAVGMASTPDGQGYWITDPGGAVSAHGDAVSYGSMAGRPLNAPITHIVATPDGKGYWLVAADGGTFAFGDAGFYGSMGGRPLNAPVVDIAPTADGKGYWLVASDGGVFAFGDATFYGSMGGKPLNDPVVGIAADNTTGGYWMVATDGGIFAFHAPFDGSTGNQHLNQPVNGMAPTVDDQGYWFVASDGGVFAFGDAGFAGSAGGGPIPAPIVGMASDTATGGYWLIGSNAQIYDYNAGVFGAD